MTTPVTSASETVVPGSHNPPPASWPPTSVTPPSEIDAAAVAADIVSSLNKALADRDYAAVADLFLPDPPVREEGNEDAGIGVGPCSYWRDHLVVSWDLRTLKGPGRIRRLLEEEGVGVDDGDGGGSGVVHFEVDDSSAFRRPQVMDFKPLGGVTGVWFFVKVEGSGGRTGRGVVRCVETAKGVWKVWTVFTSLEGVEGYEERTGARREVGVEHGGRSGRRNWAERREEEREFVGAEPEVLIIGAGQGGLTAAARLAALGISALAIDRFDAVGDNWRKRYRQLVLHDPVWYDHMPYLPFPDSWPVFTPKDKLAGWFESYVKALDLNVWTRTEVERTVWDERQRHWVVDVRRTLPDGQTQTRTLRPRHLIMATGHSGIKNMPSIPGMDSFKGNLLCHSGDFPGAKENAKGRKAVVVGACNSSMDICQDYFEKGYDVTVVQRSSTFVISSKSSLAVTLAPLYVEGGPPVEDADLTVWGMPSEVLKAVQGDLTSIATERDKDMLAGLDKAGFKTDRGPSGSGIFGKYLQRGGGYYIDVGTAQLIIDGKVKVKHGQEVAEVLPRGLRLADGTELEADEVVFATGYENMRTRAKAILGDALPDGVGDVWGWDEEGEMRGIWRNSGHPALWFHGGNLAFARYYSRLLALQIQAKLKGFKGA